MRVGGVGHPVHRVKGFEIVGPYRLRVEFADGLTRTIDLKPILEGELYGPLRDISVFNAVEIDREAHTLVWPNGADFRENDAPVACSIDSWVGRSGNGGDAGCPHAARNPG